MPSLTCPPRLTGAAGGGGGARRSGDRGRLRAHDGRRSVHGGAFSKRGRYNWSIMQQWSQDRPRDSYDNKALCTCRQPHHLHHTFIPTPCHQEVVRYLAPRKTLIHTQLKSPQAKVQNILERGNGQWTGLHKTRL